MDITNIILVLLILIVGLISISISFFKRESKSICPSPQIIYRYIPANIIDTQFSKENLPSNIYTDMFNNDNIWIGGMSMSMGKTVAASISNNKKPVPYMSMTASPSVSPKLTGPLVK